MCVQDGGSLNPKLRKLARWTAILTILFVVLQVLGIADYHFSRKVDNDPFENPVHVAQFHDDFIELDDGRKVWIDGGVSQWLRDDIKRENYRVDLEIGPQNGVHIWGKRYIAHCGLELPWIVIPVVPREIPRFERNSIIFGRLDNQIAPENTAAVGRTQSDKEE